MWDKSHWLPSCEEISRAKSLVKSGHLKDSVISNFVWRIKLKCFSFPSLSEIKTAASLAHHGLIDGEFCFQLDLKNMDLSSVPEDHFASLTSKVRKVKIQNVISPKLESLRCPFFEISDQVLNTEETEVLKRMELLKVLILSENVSLDISALTKYDGKGSIRKVTLVSERASKYRIELRAWAKRINWVVVKDYSCLLSIMKSS